MHAQLAHPHITRGCTREHAEVELLALLVLTAEGVQQPLELPPCPPGSSGKAPGRGSPGFSSTLMDCTFLGTMPLPSQGPSISSFRPKWQVGVGNLLPETGLSELLNRRLGRFCKCSTRPRDNLSNTVGPGEQSHNYGTAAAAAEGQGQSQPQLAQCFPPWYLAAPLCS